MHKCTPMYSYGFDLFPGIINNACSHEQSENDSLGTSTMELNNITFNVIWSRADFTEIFQVLQKGKKANS